MGDLTGRHALITGGGSGIGAAVAGMLAGAGASVTLAGRRLEPLQAVAAGLARATVCPANITREDDCARLVAHARATFGPVDIVVANAGSAESRSFVGTDLVLWRQTLDVNLTGTFLTVRACLPDLLRAQPDAAQPLRRIICIASTAGVKGYPYVAPYVAAKHGVVGLVRALAAEYAQTPLTVNAVCPGYVETPMTEQTIAGIVAKTGRTADQAKAALVATNPQRRLITPDEVAASVVWLCQDAARSITGQAIAVAGGEV